LNEPTAAAIAYGCDKTSEGNKKILIFDLGGGTFDVSILTMEKGYLEVIVTNGDTHLGGQDFDMALIKYCAKKFLKSTKIDILKDPKALQKMRNECEKAKRYLSASTEIFFEIPSLKNGEDFEISIGRAKFE